MKIRIEHDDDALVIVSKVNAALKEHDLVLKDDDKEHDGFIVLELIPLSSKS